MYIEPKLHPLNPAERRSIASQIDRERRARMRAEDMVSGNIDPVALVAYARAEGGGIWL